MHLWQAMINGCSFPKKEKWVCLTIVGGSSHSDESKRRGSISRRILYFKTKRESCFRGWDRLAEARLPVSDRRQRDCTAAYNDNVFIRQRIEAQWLYAAFCICTPHIAKRLYSEVMLNINNECNGKINQIHAPFQRAWLYCITCPWCSNQQEKIKWVPFICAFYIRT